MPPRPTPVVQLQQNQQPISPRPQTSQVPQTPQPGQKPSDGTFTLGTKPTSEVQSLR